MNPKSNQRFPSWLGAAAAFSLAGLLSISAYGQAFLFEDVAVNDYSGGLTLSSGSQTLRVTPEGFPNGSVSVILRDSPLGRGVIANQGSQPVSGLFAPLRFTFSLPVSSITFGFMDATGGNGGDIDGSVTIRAYDSSSALLGTMIYPNPTYDGGTYQTLSGNFAGASYFIASTASPPENLNSLIYEIVSSTAVPEPSSLALLSCCAVIGAIVSARKRR